MIQPNRFCSQLGFTDGRHHWVVLTLAGSPHAMERNRVNAVVLTPVRQLRQEDSRRWRFFELPVAYQTLRLALDGMVSPDRG